MTKLNLLALAVTSAISIAASGATLDVVPDKTTYLVGETITLSINGDAQGVTAFAIFGRLEFNGSLVDNGTRSQKTIGSNGWVKHLLEATDTHADSATSATAEAFEQNSLGDGQTATSPISTVTLIAQSVGIVTVIWNTNAGTGFELSYFGLTNAPGTSFTIVPEPSTIALVALGLMGLVLGGVRR